MARPRLGVRPPDPAQDFDSDEFFADDPLNQALDVDEEIGADLGFHERSPVTRSWKHQALRLLGLRV